VLDKQDEKSQDIPDKGNILQWETEGAAVALFSWVEYNENTKLALQIM
jgi:hypothetical protein